jgi:dTDP-4-amino-4,6-dideoxygalactose transaminase
VDKYTWVDVGSSYLPSELNAAYLYAQFDQAQTINDDRIASWNDYYAGLKDLEQQGRIELPTVPVHCMHNAHIFYIKTKDLSERTRLLRYLNENGVGAAFHYVPLHSTSVGLKHGLFHREDRYTTQESDRLIRLPMYYRLTKDQIGRIIDMIYSFYAESAVNQFMTGVI